MVRARSQLLRRRCGLALGSLLWAMASCALQAAEQMPFAAPAAQPLPSSSGGLVRVTLALIVVLAAVLGAAWFARRVRSFSAGASPSMQVLSQLSLGTRERAVLIRVGARQLLLGVAPGNVRTLHVFDEPVLAASLGDEGAAPHEAAGVPTTALRPTFKSILLRSLGK